MKTTTKATRRITDTTALDRIARLLSARTWPGASGLEDIAEIVTATGRDLRVRPDVDWPRH